MIPQTCAETHEVTNQVPPLEAPISTASTCRCNSGRSAIMPAGPRGGWMSVARWPVGH